MKQLFKKIVILIMTCVMLFSLVALAGCNDEQKTDSETSSESLSEESQDVPTESTKLTVDMSQFYEPPVLDRLNKSFVINGHTISAPEYNFFFLTAYSEYSYYAYQGYYPATHMGALDLDAPLGLIDDESTTWGDYIERIVEEEIVKVYILLSLAEEAGIVLSDEDMESIENTRELIQEVAMQEGLDSETYVAQYYGEDMTLDLFMDILKQNHITNAYVDYFLENYEFAEGEDLLPTVRHILFYVEEDASEEDINEARALAEAVMAEVSSYNDMVLLGEREMLAERARESAEYTVSLGQMVQEFEEWCFDPSREVGDKGIVQTRFGFHLMFFSGEKEASIDQKNNIADVALLDIVDELSKTENFTLIPA